MKNEYSASLTGNPFLFFETRLIAGFLLQGFDWQAIVTAVHQENSFQYRSMKSVPKRVNAIRRRVEGIDQGILERLSLGSAQEGKVIALLAIAQSDRLFREFLGEVIFPKMQGLHSQLTEGDIRRFFEAKSEEGAKVLSFTETTRKKLREIYLNILLSVGILNNRKHSQVRRMILDDEFRRILTRSFPSELIQTIEGKS